MILAFAGASVAGQRRWIRCLCSGSGISANAGAIALMGEENEGGIANIGFTIGEKDVAVIDTDAGRFSS
jgi:hypothetical protein